MMSHIIALIFEIIARISKNKKYIQSNFMKNYYTSNFTTFSKIVRWFCLMLENTISSNSITFSQNLKLREIQIL